MAVMKKIRTTLIVISIIYVVLTIFFLLNDETLFNTFNLIKLIDYLQLWILVGLVLLVGVIIAGSLYIGSLKRQNKKLEGDYNAIKARLYDIEEERKLEIEHRRREEEETEQKLDAFNKSLRNKDQSSGTDRDDRPSQV